MDLILVRKREEEPQGQEQQQKEEEEQIDFGRTIVNQVNINEEEQVENKGMGAEQIKLSREELAVEDQDLKEMFIILTHSSLLQTESREKLPKPNSDNQLKESANRVLDIYLKEVDTIPGICDKICYGERNCFQVREVGRKWLREPPSCLYFFIRPSLFYCLTFHV